jgi:hypothetical protein
MTMVIIIVLETKIITLALVIILATGASVGLRGNYNQFEPSPMNKGTGPGVEPLALSVFFQAGLRFAVGPPRPHRARNPAGNNLTEAWG